MKAVFSYFVVLMSAFIYMLLFDRDAGGIMTVFLIVVPVVSVFLTLFARKKISFSVKLPDEFLVKNRIYQVDVSAAKSTFLPIPVVSFEFSATEHFRRPDYDVYRFSMSENRKVSVNIEIFPEVCGTAGVSVRKIYITDYLGIFRFRVPVQEISGTACIMAEIHELNEYSELLRSIYNTLPDNDDDKDTSVVYGKTALPGYGYRSYVPGDSLKKINWKLSSKKNELYVRMDESAGMTLPNIILDTNLHGDSGKGRASVYHLGLITEAALSVLSMCVSNGIECRFTYPADGQMFTETVSSPDEVMRISCEMLLKMGKPCEVTFESDNDSKSSDVNIVCTLGITEALAEAAEVSENEGNSVKFVIPDELSRENTAAVSELWLLRDDWSLSRAV